MEPSTRTRITARNGETLGTMIGANDLFIAAHARSLGLMLVTNNTREFGRVRDLAIENWTLAASYSVSRQVRRSR
jgi:predicted nucleic acid-binding protein